jgi:hypothetical protein
MIDVLCVHRRVGNDHGKNKETQETARVVSQWWGKSHGDRFRLEGVVAGPQG